MKRKVEKIQTHCGFNNTKDEEDTFVIIHRGIKERKYFLTHASSRRIERFFDGFNIFDCGMLTKNKKEPKKLIPYFGKNYLGFFAYF